MFRFIFGFAVSSALGALGCDAPRKPPPLPTVPLSPDAGVAVPVIVRAKLPEPDLSSRDWNAATDSRAQIDAEIQRVETYLPTLAPDSPTRPRMLWDGINAYQQLLAAIGPRAAAEDDAARAYERLVALVGMLRGTYPGFCGFGNGTACGDEALYLLAEAHRFVGQPERALEPLVDLVSTWPQGPWAAWARFLIGEIHRAAPGAARRPLAIAAYEAALAGAGAEVQIHAWLRISQLRWEAGDQVGALAAAKQAVAASPQDTSVFAAVPRRFADEYVRALEVSDGTGSAATQPVSIPSYVDVPPELTSAEAALVDGLLRPGPLAPDTLAGYSESGGTYVYAAETSEEGTGTGLTVVFAKPGATEELEIYPPGAVGHEVTRAVNAYRPEIARRIAGHGYRGLSPVPWPQPDRATAATEVALPGRTDKLRWRKRALWLVAAGGAVTPLRTFAADGRHVPQPRVIYQDPAQPTLLLKLRWLPGAAYTEGASIYETLEVLQVPVRGAGGARESVPVRP